MYTCTHAIRAQTQEKGSTRVHTQTCAHAHKQSSGHSLTIIHANVNALTWCKHIRTSTSTPTRISARKHTRICTRVSANTYMHTDMRRYVQTNSDIDADASADICTKTQA